MKKIYLLSLVALSTLLLAGCLPKKDETKTVGTKETVEMKEELSEDNSLDTIEKELNDTDLTEFDSELNALDKEINQL